MHKKTGSGWLNESVEELQKIVKSENLQNSLRENTKSRDPRQVLEDALIDAGVAKNAAGVIALDADKNIGKEYLNDLAEEERWGFTKEMIPITIKILGKYYSGEMFDEEELNESVNDEDDFCTVKAKVFKYRQNGSKINSGVIEMDKSDFEDDQHLIQQLAIDGYLAGDYRDYEIGSESDHKHIVIYRVRDDKPVCELVVLKDSCKSSMSNSSIRPFISFDEWKEAARKQGLKIGTDDVTAGQYYAEDENGRVCGRFDKEERYGWINFSSNQLNESIDDEDDEPVPVQVSLKAGEYWIGDLCYVLHEVWDEVVDLIYKDSEEGREGAFTLSDGRKFVLFNTAYGDGEYRDQNGNEYGVDAGNIGIIRVSDINTNVEENKDFEETGHIFNFPSAFWATTDGNGMLRFGHVRINTRRGGDRWLNESDRVKASIAGEAEEAIRDYWNKRMSKRAKDIVGALTYDLYYGVGPEEEIYPLGKDGKPLGWRSALEELRDIIDELDGFQDLWYDAQGGKVLENEPRGYKDEDGEWVEPMWDDIHYFEAGDVKKIVLGDELARHV